MQAGVSAAANVIVAAGEVAGAEIETALTGVLASPILQKGYDVLMLEEALYEAISYAHPSRKCGEHAPHLGPTL